MAKYTLNFSCGHEETIQLFGPNKERSRKIEWFESNGSCSTCYRAAKEAEYQKKAEEQKKQNALAAQEATASGWVKLTGSDKQIAWGDSIRVNLLKQVEQRMNTGKADDEPKRQAIRKAYQTLFVEAYTSASWWIDHRSWGASDIGKTLVDWVKANCPGLITDTRPDAPKSIYTHTVPLDPEPCTDGTITPDTRIIPLEPGPA